jgi:hypothetical protein
LVKVKNHKVHSRKRSRLGRKYVVLLRGMEGKRPLIVRYVGDKACLGVCTEVRGGGLSVMLGIRGRDVLIKREVEGTSRWVGPVVWCERLKGSWGVTAGGLIAHRVAGEALMD